MLHKTTTVVLCLLQHVVCFVMAEKRSVKNSSFTGTQVLGLACTNSLGQYGILASTHDGIVTDNSWWCSSEVQVGWATPEFTMNGSGGTGSWQPATEVASYKQRFQRGLASISSKAKWIWTGRSKTVFCRKGRGNICRWCWP